MNTRDHNIIHIPDDPDDSERKHWQLTHVDDPCDDITTTSDRWVEWLKTSKGTLDPPLHS